VVCVYVCVCVWYVCVYVCVCGVCVCGVCMCGVCVCVCVCVWFVGPDTAQIRFFKLSTG